MTGANGKYNKELLFSFFAPVVVLSFAFALFGVHFFSDFTVLGYDLSGQYLPFLISLSRRLRGEASFFWSWEMGADYIVNIPYYLTCPLSFLAALLPEDYIRYAVLPLILIKVGFAGLFMGLYLKNTAISKNGFSFFVPLFASLYALCAFSLQNFWNIIWLNSFALFPLVMLGLRLFTREGKFKLYVISLFLLIVFNFYIGWYTCIFIVPMFFGECYILGLDKKTLLKKTAVLAGLSVLAVLLGAFVLLPVFLHIIGVFGTQTPPQSFFLHNPLDIFAYLAPFRPRTYRVSVLPHAYCGVLSVIGAGLFFSLKAVCKKEKRVYAVLLALMFLSVIIAPLDFFWNALRSPITILYRYIFIIPFILVTMGYKALAGYTAQNGEELNVKKTALAAVFIFLVITGLILEDGMPYLTPFLILVVLYIYLLYHYGNKQKRVIAAAVTILAAAELIISAFIITSGYPGYINHSYYTLNRSVSNELLKNRDNTAAGFYRTEFTDHTIASFNPGLFEGVNGISAWSSVINTNYPRFFGSLGLASVSDLLTEYSDTSPVVPMFTSLRYVVSRSGLSNKLWSEAARANGVALYENKYCLPFGFMVNGELKNYEPAENNPILSQNMFFALATGIKEPLFTFIQPDFSNASSSVITPLENGAYHYKTISTGQTLIKADFKAEKAGLYYGFCDMALDNWQQTDVTVIFEQKEAFKPIREQFPGFFEGNEKNPGKQLVLKPNVFTVGELSQEDAFSFAASAYNNEAVFIYIAARLNEDVLTKGYETLSNEPLVLTEFKDTYIKGTVAAAQSGLLYTSIPIGTNKHWRAYVNGIKQEIVLTNGLMAALELQEGEYVIEFKYFNTHFAAGLIISGLALLVFTGLIIKKEKL